MLVVDDGSGREYEKIFAKVETKAAVLHNPENLGKGATLKRGMRELKQIYPDCTHFITVDSDGQHRLEDILQVHEALLQGSHMVLTMRDFQGKIPARSRFGNGLSRIVYTLLTGHYLADNQSGLRGYSVEDIDWLLQVEGEKYDYEMNAIYYADKQNIDITTVPIESIYIDDNRSSHFEPAMDTFRIYKCLFTSAKGILITALLYELMVIAGCILWDDSWQMLVIPAAGVCSVCIGYVIDRLQFRAIENKNGIRIFAGILIRTLIYTIGYFVMQMLLPKIPVWLAFNLMVLVMIPVRYIVRRLCTGRSSQRVR
jgi:putative flippase GtrA